ncbi:MAG: M48 family metalloprotease [Spirochaetaceae bacterium]|jgi:predicted Zn-dependent protease|nr:M48 family metalloprotease [Spirochaetaceae bacterium]
MKKRILSGAFLLILAFSISSSFLSCESMDSSLKGNLAGTGAGILAGALGADSDTAARIAQGVSKGVATFDESKKAADSLTPENEYYLGRAVAANIAAKYNIYSNAALQTYLDKICNTLVINSPNPDIYKGYHVAILDTMEINAFATPGGHIFVTRGLIACASNEDALASVIAHEIAHIQLRHALTSIRNARYVNAAVSGALAGIGEGVGGNAKELASVMSDSVNEVITTLVVNGFSKAQELEADATALSLLAGAGYQPSGIVEMLQSLKQKQQGSQGFGKTHPSPDERIANVNRNMGKYTVADTRVFRVSRYNSAVPK